MVVRLTGPAHQKEGHMTSNEVLRSTEDKAGTEEQIVLDLPALEQMAYSLEEPEPQPETGMWPVFMSWRWVMLRAGRIMLAAVLVIMAIVAASLVIPYHHQATVPTPPPTSIVVGPPPPVDVPVPGPPFNAVTPDAQHEILPPPPPAAPSGPCFFSPATPQCPPQGLTPDQRENW